MAGNIINIDANELNKLLENDEAVLIDVRQPDEYRSASIKGAINIPLEHITKYNLPELNGKKLVLQCQSGTRSILVCQQLSTEHKIDNYNLSGGIKGWKKAKLPIEKHGIGYSIMQQVQIIIGIGVLFGTLAAIYLNFNWIYLPMFFGAGLLFAGLSGWCGMAKFVALLPWNKVDCNYNNKAEKNTLTNTKPAYQNN